MDLDIFKNMRIINYKNIIIMYNILVFMNNNYTETDA